MSLRRMVSAAKRELAVWRAVLRDDRTPRAARWILAGLFAYLASPVDLIPDFIPGLGFLDDLVVLAGGLWLLAILGVLSSVIAAYYYLRVVKILFFDPPANVVVQGSGEQALVNNGLMLVAALFCSPIGYLLLGPLANATRAAAGSLF